MAVKDPGEQTGKLHKGRDTSGHSEGSVNVLRVGQGQGQGFLKSTNYKKRRKNTPTVSNTPQDGSIRFSANLQMKNGFSH